MNTQTISTKAYKNVPVEVKKVGYFYQAFWVDPIGEQSRTRFHFTSQGARNEAKQLIDSE